jgi:hypothetical protein
MHHIMHGLYIEIMTDYVKINRRLSLCLFFKQNGPIMLKKVAAGIFWRGPPPSKKDPLPFFDPTPVFFSRPFLNI